MATLNMITNGLGWYRGQVAVPCGDCGQGQMVGTGDLATGETLANGYTPTAGEILSIGLVRCDKCGAWQAS